MIRFLTSTEEEVIIHLDDIYIANSSDLYYVCNVHTDLTWTITGKTYMEIQNYFAGLSPIVEFSLGE